MNKIKLHIQSQSIVMHPTFLARRNSDLETRLKTQNRG